MMNNYSKAKDELIYQGHFWAFNKIKEIGATHALTLSFSAPFTDIGRDEKDRKLTYLDGEDLVSYRFIWFINETIRLNINIEL